MIACSPYREAILEAAENLALNCANALDDGHSERARASLIALALIFSVRNETAKARLLPMFTQVLARYGLPMIALQLAEIHE